MPLHKDVDDEIDTVEDASGNSKHVGRPQTNRLKVVSVIQPTINTNVLLKAHVGTMYASQVYDDVEHLQHSARKRPAGLLGKAPRIDNINDDDDEDETDNNSAASESDNDDDESGDDNSEGDDDSDNDNRTPSEADKARANTEKREKQKMSCKLYKPHYKRICNVLYDWSECGRSAQHNDTRPEFIKHDIKGTWLFINAWYAIRYERYFRDKAITPEMVEFRLKRAICDLTYVDKKAVDPLLAHAVLYAFENVETKSYVLPGANYIKASQEQTKSWNCWTCIFDMEQPLQITNYNGTTFDYQKNSKGNFIGAIVDNIDGGRCYVFDAASDAKTVPIDRCAVQLHCFRTKSKMLPHDGVIPRYCRIRMPRREKNIDHNGICSVVTEIAWYWYNGASCVKNGFSTCPTPSNARRGYFRTLVNALLTITPHCGTEFYNAARQAPQGTPKTPINALVDNGGFIPTVGGIGTTTLERSKRHKNIYSPNVSFKVWPESAVDGRRKSDIATVKYGFLTPKERTSHPATSTKVDVIGFVLEPRKYLESCFTRNSLGKYKPIASHAQKPNMAIKSGTNIKPSTSSSSVKQERRAVEKKPFPTKFSEIINISDDEDDDDDVSNIEVDTAPIKKKRARVSDETVASRTRSSQESISPTPSYKRPKPSVPTKTHSKQGPQMPTSKR